MKSPAAAMPNDVAAWAQTAKHAVESGDGDAVERAFRRLAELLPDEARAHFNHAKALGDLGRHAEAEVALRLALRLAPDLAQANTNLGNLLTRAGRLEEAEPFLARATQLQPELWRAHFNLATLLQRRGRLDDARHAVERALSLAVDAVEAHQLRLLLALYSGDGTDEALFDLHRQAAGAIARQNNLPTRYHANAVDPERRLRIGYVSPDLRAHSVAYFFEGVLAAHDRQQVEVFCYSDVGRPDEVTKRLRATTDHWRDIRKFDLDRLAAQVQTDRIDVLIDLAGHTRDNRIGLFARKAAPLQASWIGYPATTGLDTIDFRFTDAIVDPPGTSEALHSETLVRLEPCFLAYRPPTDAPQAAGGPGDCPALRGEAPVFGSFNNIAKLSAATVETWAALLHAVPEAKLVLKSSGVADRQSFAWFDDILASKGVMAERIEFLPFAPTMAEHLALYRRIDVALDTFPYNGTTTTCEALLMGVPVIVLAGAPTRHAARVGQSLLHAMGLDEFVAADRAEYVAKATNLARDHARIGELRGSLRNKLLASPLCDAPGLTRQVEAAYRKFWRQWCHGQTASQTTSQTASQTGTQ
ncbi:MAG: tetratricopeptide repeat protein [Rhodospirillales bacterium]